MDLQQQKEIEELKSYIQQLQKKITIYETLAEAVRLAHVQDRSIYSHDANQEDYLAIDREDYAKCMEIISEVDLWKPWKHTLQRRITNN